jgi:hypothetical protein
MASEKALGHGSGTLRSADRAVARAGAGAMAAGDLDAAAGDAVWRTWVTGL